MGSTSKGIDILYVDDDEVDIQCVQREFKKVSNLLHIDVARDGTQALDKLYGRNGMEKLDPSPKMILLDINMPKMSGIEFLQTLRRDPDFNDTAIYILTVSYTTKDKLALHDLKVSGFIVKPLEYSDALNIFWTLFSDR